MTARTALILAAWAATCTAWLLWVAWRYLRERADRVERSETARRDIQACLMTLELRRARHDAAVKGWRTRRRVRLCKAFRPRPGVEIVNQK